MADYCKSCGEPIRWALMTGTGHAMPLNPDPDPEGNVAIIESGDKSLAKIISKTSSWEGDRYMPHFVTCPQGKAWSKKQ
jgi:hypothetical protein